MHLYSTVSITSIYKAGGPELAEGPLLETSLEGLEAGRLHHASGEGVPNPNARREEGVEHRVRVAVWVKKPLVMTPRRRLGGYQVSWYGSPGMSIRLLTIRYIIVAFALDLRS